MAHVKKSRVQDTGTGSGTGAITLAGSAPTGYRAFSAVMSNGDTCFAVIVDRATGVWEESLCTYSSGGVLTRSTVLDGTSGPGVSVSFAAGTKDVFIGVPATKNVAEDNNGDAAVSRNLAVTGAISGSPPGTWTPADASGAGLALTINSARYSKVGCVAVLTFDITYPATADASQAKLSGIPAACAPVDTNLGAAVGLLGPVTGGALGGGPIGVATYSLTSLSLWQGNGFGSIVTNANLTGARIRGTITIITAS